MATQIATREPTNNSPITVLRSQLEKSAEEFRMVLPSHIPPEKLQRTILTAVQLNPDLLNGDRKSFIAACFKAAQDGLLPDGREAALVVYNTRQKIDGQWATVKQINYLPMVWGLRKKILQSDEITDLFAAVVYRQEIEAGRFIYEEGTERMLRHKPILDADFVAKDEDIALVYSVATFKDGSKSFEVMRRSEVDRIRQLSQTGATGKTDRQGNPIQAKGPWVDFYSEMAKKTVIRRHSKSLPMSGDVFADVEGAAIDAAARSAVAALSLAPGGQPQAIEDHTDDTPEHDPETGEIINDDANVTGDDTSAERVNETAKAEPDKKPAQRRGRASAEGNADVTSASEKPVAGNDAAKAEASAELARDEQTGITKDPFEEKGDEYVARLSKAETIIDLNAVHAEFERESEGWPYEIVQAIAAEHKRHTRRLSPAKAELETTSAK